MWSTEQKTADFCHSKSRDFIGLRCIGISGMCQSMPIISEVRKRVASWQTHLWVVSRVVFVQKWTRNILGGEKRASTTFLTVWHAPVGAYYWRLCSFSYQVRSKVKCCWRSKTFRKLIRRVAVVWIAGSRFICWVNPSAAQVAVSWKSLLAKETQFYFQEMRLAKFDTSKTPTRLKT